MVTDAPSRASASTIAAPIPLLAPVTSAARPSNVTSRFSAAAKPGANRLCQLGMALIEIMIGAVEEDNIDTRRRSSGDQFIGAFARLDQRVGRALYHQRRALHVRRAAQDHGPDLRAVGLHRTKCRKDAAAWPLIARKPRITDDLVAREAMSEEDHVCASPGFEKVDAGTKVMMRELEILGLGEIMIAHVQRQTRVALRGEQRRQPARRAAIEVPGQSVDHQDSRAPPLLLGIGLIQRTIELDAIRGVY